MEHRQRAVHGERERGTDLLRTLLVGTLLSVGLGFFTGGLQHFPDSPARSGWVVPLGFALSVPALFWSLRQDGVLPPNARGWRYGLVGTVLVALASWGAYTYLQAHPQYLAPHAHGGEVEEGHGDAHTSLNSAAPSVASAHVDAADAATAYTAANAKMHQAMSAPLTGNADVDFLSGMIAHHQGAVDMARIVLQHGQDPQVRELAQNIITAQEKEITTMHGWLLRLDHSKHAHH